MSKKNKKPKISFDPVAKIPTTDISSRNTRIVFSYEHLDSNNSKYSLDILKDTRVFNQFTKEFFCKLQEYCAKEDFKKALSDKYWKKKNHIHPIDWKDPQIHETSFTNLDESLMEQVKDECWQLGINNNGFRIHGFFIGNVYYVVWLDPLHKLYPRK